MIIGMKRVRRGRVRILIVATALYFVLLGLFVYTIAPSSLVGLVSAASEPQEQKQQPIVGMKPHSGQFLTDSVEESLASHLSVSQNGTEVLTKDQPQFETGVNSGLLDTAVKEEAIVEIEKIENPTEAVHSSIEQADNHLLRPIPGQQDQLSTLPINEDTLFPNGQLIIPSIGVDHIITNVPVEIVTWIFTGGLQMPHLGV